MNNIDRHTLRDIALEVVEAYDPIPLPDLDDVSWAFPVQGDAGYYLGGENRERILNTQEFAALYNLMIFRNFHNVLTSWAEGRVCRGGYVPTCTPTHDHSWPDATDIDKVHWHYYKELPQEVKRERDLEYFTKRGYYFWENMPEEIVREILRAHNTVRSKGRPMDEWGFFDADDKTKVNDFREDSGLARTYLTHVKRASELGRKYFRRVAENKGLAEEYDQLVLDNAMEEWDHDTQIQLGCRLDGHPRLNFGRNITCEGDTVHLEWYLPDWADVRAHCTPPKKDSLSIEKLKQFKKSLWRMKPSAKK